MQRLRLCPALLERVLAGLGLAVQLLLALFVVLLVAPDLPRLLHLGAAEGGQERDERGEAAHHAGVGRAAHHHPGGPRLAAARPSSYVGLRACSSLTPSLGCSLGCLLRAITFRFSLLFFGGTQSPKCDCCVPGACFPQRLQPGCTGHKEEAKKAGYPSVLQAASRI